MKTLILLCAQLFFSLIVAGQTTEFQKEYGGSKWDLGQSVCQTADGGYIVSGRTSSYGEGNEDVYLIKTDAAGDTLWTRTFGGSGNDYGYTVRVTTDGGYLISGHTDSFGHGDCDGLVLKFNSSGTLMWMNTYGTPKSEITSSFNFTNDGGYILVGIHGDITDSLDQVYLVKTDVNGDTLWTKYYGTNASTTGYYVCQTADSGYVFTGCTTNYGPGKMDMLLGKTDKWGNLQWMKTYGGDSNDIAYCMQITAEGGYIMAGYTHSYGAGDDDGYVVKTDAQGNTIWAKTYGGSKLDRFNHIEHTTDGGYILSGMTKSFGAGGSDVYVVKIDSAGNQLWAQTYGDTADQVNGCIKQCADGGFIIAGSSSNNCNPMTGDYNVFLIKTDKDGNTVTGLPNIKQAEAGIKAYPNPFSQSTTFDIPAGLLNDNLTLTMYDITGKQVSEYDNISHLTSVNIQRDNLQAGMYFYRFTSNGQPVGTGKIIVQN